MDLKRAVNGGNFTRAAIRHTRKFYARVIPYGSYSETLAARLLMMIGIGMLAGMTLWMLVALSIL